MIASYSAIRYDAIEGAAIWRPLRITMMTGGVHRHPSVGVSAVEGC